MTFTAVLLVCTAGIAACAALVFLVETVVAFWLQKSEGELPVLAVPRLAEEQTRPSSEKKAA